MMTIVVKCQSHARKQIREPSSKIVWSHVEPISETRNDGLYLGFGGIKSMFLKCSDEPRNLVYMDVQDLKSSFSCFRVLSCVKFPPQKSLFFIVSWERDILEGLAS